MTTADERGGRLVAHPAGRRGTLRTAAGRALPVSTFDRGDAEVVLVAIPDAGDALAARAPDEATLEYASARGMIRLHGEAVLERPSLIRFHAEGDAEVVQRRQFVRVTTPQRVTLDPAPDATPAHTVDLSGGGMLLHGAPALAPGDRVGFEIRLGGEPTPIVGIAKVVRADDDGRRALAFERLGETDREALIRFVFACLRVAQAKTRH